MIRQRVGIGTLRFRIAFGYFLGALIVSSFVAGSTYALTREYLTRQRIDVVLRQSFNSLRFASEYLDRPGARGQLDQMAAFLQTRGTTEVLLVGAGESVASSVSITQETIPPQLISAVGGGLVGYAVFGESPRRVAFGSTIPRSGLEAFFVYSLQELDNTLALVARVLLGVVSVSVVVAAVVGVRLAQRTVEPLSRAGEAAQRVAEGLLDTRLEEARDEVGVLAASFNRMASALQERMVRERRFVSDASHELRTPLTALKASIDYLADHGEELPERLGQAARLAASEVRALQRLVDDLLELSRVEAGAVEVASEEIDLAGFVHEVVRRRAGGHPVRVGAPDDAVIVRTDKMRLQRVVGNLLENAVVHGGEDVEIRVALNGDGAPSIRVSDKGPGIPTSDLPRIFERFWRADRARQRGTTGGSGLGLAIARENASVLGAELDVHSEASGTTFTVTLPAAAAASKAAQAEWHQTFADG